MIMRILFFTKGDSSVGSSRQRVWRVAERLKQNYGWDYEVLHSIGYSLFSVSRSRFKLFFNLCFKLHVSSFKIIFVHKSLYPWDVVLFILCAKKLFGKKLVYDLDDAEWIHSPRKSRTLARHADAVFCGSHEILRWAQQYNTNCIFVPTVLDASLYERHTVTHDRKDKLTVGWIGHGKGHFKAGNFAVLKNVLIKLFDAGILFRFVIAVSQNYQPLHEFFSNTPFEVVFVDEADWLREDTAPKLIQAYAFDVGVMPLTDTSFNRAKCAFKALEYLACGVPVVASPVGEANYVIKNNENGFFANSADEWVFALGRLLKDASLRERLGRQGQQLVRDHYSYQNTIPQVYAEIIKFRNS